MRTLNLGILAHVDAGKTSLTERLSYAAGVIDEVGSVDDGSTQTDSLALERQRGITIKSAVVSFAIGDVTVNLIDTPGHPDFIAEVERVLSVLDGALPLAFRKAVEESVRETLRQGLHGWEVPDCTVTMTHSGYSPRQSHSPAIFDKSMSSTGADFRGLTPLVLMSALKRAGTRVYEPVHRFGLEAPADTLESAFDRYEPVAGPPPDRPRTDHHPLDRKEYLLHVMRRV
jgi:small GTP-binding protein